MFSIISLYSYSCSESSEEKNTDTPNNTRSEEVLKEKEVTPVATNNSGTEDVLEEKETTPAAKKSEDKIDVVKEKEPTPVETKNADKEKTMKEKERTQVSASKEIEQLREKKKNMPKEDLKGLIALPEPEKSKSKMIQKHSAADQNSIDSIRSKKAKKKFSNEEKMIINNSLPQN